MKKFFFTLLILSIRVVSHSQEVPQLGAEIYLEPGQTTEQVTGWVKTMAEMKMPVVRVFMMWNYLEPKPGEWDFSLYDSLFKAAEEFGVKITPTLVPNSPPFHRGKSFFFTTHNMAMFENEEYKEKSKIYIQKVVERYKNSKALDSWWLYNEPGQAPTPNALAINDFKPWLQKKYQTIDALNKSWQSYYANFEEIQYDNLWISKGWTWQNVSLDWSNFWTGHLNNQIEWLASEVRKYDQVHPFHTNPASLVTSLRIYDLPGMKKIVSSLGASMHPSWHFTSVPRNKFGLTVSWQNNLIYNVAREKPYWISELQAGNNLYSGQNPMCPTPNDIAQWVWTSLGSGSKRVIFWLLNNRMQGNESAEWALLDFQQKPSERLLKAQEIAEILQKYAKDFDTAKPIVSPVTIILSPQTLLLQERKQNNNSNIPAVKELAHQKAAMACYNSLMSQGIPVTVKLNSMFNWDTNEKKQVLILPDVMCLTQDDINGIERFVKNGNKVIATGLTGLYDENEKTWVVNRDFPLDKVFGGSFQEIFAVSENFEIKLNEYRESFPTQLWYTQILPSTGKVIGSYNGKPVAVKNAFGKGEVTWVPSMIDLGAWSGSSVPLAQFLLTETNEATKDLKFRFTGFHENCYMQTLKTGDGYITVIANGGLLKQQIFIKTNKPMKSEILYGKSSCLSGNSLTIDPNETFVIKWFEQGL